MSFKKINVINGPSKFDLMLSLFDQKEIFFTVYSEQKKIKLGFVITKVSFVNQAESDTWEIAGFITSIVDIIVENDIYIRKEHSLELIYNSRTRKGNIVKNLSTNQRYDK